ncbi:MAG: type II secretion system F family protein [Candidatus Hydrogenedentes bacterium]|nr:type II secretion system F family protein [Candidatus Hydrogenedentota bacterium]
MAMKGDKPAAGGIKRVSRSTKRTGGRKVTAKSTFDLDDAVEAAEESKPVTLRAFTGGSLFPSGIGPVSDHDITDILRQLIMLLDAGTPFLKSLTILSQRSEKGRVRALVSDICSFVENGNALWQAFERHPRQFDPVFISLVKASEASGTLTTVLKRLIVYRERREMMVRRMRGAMIYPIILVVVCFLVLFLIAKVVVPQFQEIFAKLETQIPWYTQTLINTVNVLSSWQVLGTVAVVIIVLIVLYNVLHRMPLWRIRLDRWKMRIPKIGKAIVRKRAVVEFTQSLSLLLRSGLSMMTTLDLVRNVIHNKAMAHALQGVRDAVERGEGIEQPMRAARGIFPPVVVDMLVTGEESGQLDSIAEHVALTYEEELGITISTLGELLQPVLTVVIGLVVMILFLALFVPMITMLNDLGNSVGG